MLYRMFNFKKKKKKALFLKLLVEKMEIGISVSNKISYYNSTAYVRNGV